MLAARGLRFATSVFLLLVRLSWTVLSTASFQAGLANRVCMSCWSDSTSPGTPIPNLALTMSRFLVYPSRTFSRRSPLPSYGVADR